MIRPDIELHQILVSEWTPEEAFHHLKTTFDQAALKHPDLFEQYHIRLADAEPQEETAIMREGLRITFRTRYPNPFLEEVGE